MTQFLEQNANSEVIASQLAKEIMINLGPEGQNGDSYYDDVFSNKELNFRL